MYTGQILVALLLHQGEMKVPKSRPSNTTVTHILQLKVMGYGIPN